MKTVVVYRSRSGNTKGIAELMAKKLGTKALPVNFISKKGEGFEGGARKGEAFFEEALEACKGADLAIVGTSVSSRKRTPISRDL